MKRLSYANVMATAAVMIALGGSATAAVTFPRNSVGSKQIRNGQVASRDIKNATVRGTDVKPGSLTGAHLADGSVGGADVADAEIVASDLANGAVGGAKIADRGVGAADIADGAVGGAKIADGSVTGADVKESSLATVPNASKLDGVDSTGFARSGGRVFSDTFSEGDDLVLGVPGYGSFRLFCDDNNTPSTPGDDQVSYAFQQILGPGALQGMRATFADSVLDDPTTVFFNPDVGDGLNSIASADRVEVDQYLRSRSGDKAIRISAWGFDDPTSTTDCTGMLEAQILR